MARRTTPLLALCRATPPQVAGGHRPSAPRLRVAITPQGGNTGLVGGQIPQGEILLSTERLRAVRDLNRLDDVLVAEAGLTLAETHAAAQAAGRRFPLDLASEGSATLGGLISTNAGGTAVLRYGTMRGLVLGLEAMLPDGSVWNGLKRLRKDNTGYDLKQMLIGAEGTLGVVTAAALRLAPILASRAVALAAVTSPRDGDRAAGPGQGGDRRRGGGVRADQPARRRTRGEATCPALRDPLETATPWVVLIEIASARARRRRSRAGVACCRGRWRAA